MKRRAFTYVMLALLIGPRPTVWQQPLSPELAAGYKAGFTCSAVFHAGRTLDEILVDELAGDEAYMIFPGKELFNRIGMRHTFAETDPLGNFIMSSQVYTTPRDLARFGMLFLHDGVWEGDRILPEGWVEYTCTPAPAHEAGGYGAQWWLSGTDPRLPEDAFSTGGARGQYCTVVPSKDLVVVRTGIDPQQSKWDQIAFVAAMIAALPN